MGYSYLHHRTQRRSPTRSRKPLKTISLARQTSKAHPSSPRSVDLCTSRQILPTSIAEASMNLHRDSARASRRIPAPAVVAVVWAVGQVVPLTVTDVSATFATANVGDVFGAHGTERGGRVGKRAVLWFSWWCLSAKASSRFVELRLAW